MEQNKEQQRTQELGRVIAQESRNLQLQNQKNMAKAAKRQQTMLENAAERALSGK